MPVEVFVHISDSLFFFNDTATTEIYTLSLHDALPICQGSPAGDMAGDEEAPIAEEHDIGLESGEPVLRLLLGGRDRKSTRLNSSHANISYAVFCLKKKNDPGLALRARREPRR